MKAKFALALTCATACLVAGASSAHAVQMPGLPGVPASDVMLNGKDATDLGIAKKRIQTLTATTSNDGPVDDIWLCDLSGDSEVDIPGTRSLVKSVARSQDDSPLDLAVHEFHIFPSAKAAKQAYTSIVTKARTCTGTHTPAADVDMSDMPGSVNKSTTLTSGVKKATDGDQFVWIESRTTTPDAATNYAENSYRTLRQVGSMIQVLYIENEGEGVAPLSKPVRNAADRLTDGLGDRVLNR